MYTECTSNMATWLNDRVTASHCTVLFTYLLTYLLTSLTNFFAKYDQWSLYGTLVVTLAMLLSLINCRFIIIIIIIDLYAHGISEGGVVNCRATKTVDSKPVSASAHQLMQRGDVSVTTGDV